MSVQLLGFALPSTRPWPPEHSYVHLPLYVFAERTTRVDKTSMPSSPNPLGSTGARSAFAEALRLEKLERIRRRVETGTYFVDLEVLAARIVDDGGIR
jgi:hypothetical protein